MGNSASTQNTDPNQFISEIRGKPSHDDLILRDGTDEQWRNVVARSYLDSGRGLSRPDYCERSRLQKNSAFSKKHGRFW
jgi:hypothetical protein